MSQKNLYLSAEVDGIHEVKRSIVKLSSTMEDTLNDPKVLRKTQKALLIQGLGKKEIRDIILDRIREKW